MNGATTQGELWELARQRARTVRFRVIRLRIASGASLLTVLAGLAFIPFATDNAYYLSLATLTVMWMGLALSYNVFAGFTGYFSFGHAAFLGLGAYTVGIGLTRYGLSLALALALAFVLGVTFALMLGLLTLRVRAHYFAILTLAAAEAMQVSVNYFRDFTQGTFGFSLPASVVALSGQIRFFVVLSFTGLALALSAAILWSSYGVRLLAIREDEMAAEALGIRTIWYKASALALSGGLTALFGGAFAWELGYLTPEAVLDPIISLQIVVMVILGGTGTILGPPIGAAAFYLLNEFVLEWYRNLHLAVIGAVLIVTLLGLRRGVVGSLYATRIWPKGLRL